MLAKISKVCVLCLSLYVGFVGAEPLNHLIEFFSFTCGHCMKVESSLKQVLATTNARFLPVMIVQNTSQIATAMLYDAAIYDGLGWQFRDAYFAAVGNGFTPYTPSTALLVLHQITNDPNQVLLLVNNPQVRRKYTLDQLLIEKYNVTSTPTFVFNKSYVAVGDSALNRFLQR